MKLRRFKNEAGIGKLYRLSDNQFVANVDYQCSPPCYIYHVTGFSPFE